MTNIQVRRYKDTSHGWAGWLEPDDRTWIAFIGLDGRPIFYLHRDPESGAILPDDESEREAHLVELRRARGLYTGVTVTEEESKQPGVSAKPGEIVFPLGVDGRGKQ